MKREIKDYLHLYMGCEMVNETAGLSDILTPMKLIQFLENGWKPILRPLTDMTDEDYTELGKIEIKWSPFERNVECHAEKIKYYLSKHFDLFNLINDGLAIDKTTLNKTVAQYFAFKRLKKI